MATQRIGDAGLGAKKRHATTRLGAITRLGAAMASPLGILFIVPGLVAAVGLFFAISGDRALRGSNRDVARERLGEQTRLVAGDVRAALAEADPILDRLEDLARAHSPDRPHEDFAHALADLLAGRPGVAYVSASFPDGTFEGVYLDDDGETRFQVSRVGADGTTVKRFSFGERGRLVPYREERSTYDPRQRGFYQLAVGRGGRAFTDPYPFFGTHYTGITRTSPVYATRDGETRLHAVVTVDFDVNALSSFLRERQLPGVRAMLFSRSGSLLAYSEEIAALARGARPADRPLTYSDLRDPVLDALFRGLEHRPASTRQLFDVEAKDVDYLVSVAPVESDDSLDWYVAYVVPESRILRGLHVYEQRSLVVGGIALTLAVLVAWAFAHFITRVRREAAVAHERAAEAEKTARELGSYRLVECLGRGGMGEVWRAEHRLLAREAAIKLINPKTTSAQTEEMQIRFRREAETLASLRSRNTIELFDYGVSSDGTFFFVMELLDGMDFESLVEKYGPLPAGRVVHLIVQACNSLAEAHDRGFVHRDVKPANLFACRAADEVDVVKVLDFGLVRATRVAEPTVGFDSDAALAAAVGPGTSRVTRAGGLMGTPGYMPPEQIEGKELDARADLYALACVAHWLLTGRLVFERPQAMQLVFAHLQEPVPDLREQMPAGVPDALADLLASCLAKEPGERPANARELARALRAVAIPEELSWDDERASAWWAEHRPKRPPMSPRDEETRELAVAQTIVSNA